MGWFFNWKPSGGGKNYDKEIKQINDNLNEIGNDLNDLDSVAAKRNEVNVFQKQMDMKDRLVFKPENTLNTKDLIRYNLETFTYGAGKYLDAISITRGSSYLFKWRIGMDADGINNTSWQSDITHNFVLPVGFNGSETKFYRGFNSVGNSKLWRITELGQDTGTEAYILPRKDTGKSTLKFGNSTKNDDKRYDLDMESRSRIVNLPQPTGDNQPATKIYVDNAIANIPSGGTVNITDEETLTNLTLNGKPVYCKNYVWTGDTQNLDLIILENIDGFWFTPIMVSGLGLEEGTWVSNDSINHDYIKISLSHRTAINSVQLSISKIDSGYPYSVSGVKTILYYTKV